MRRCSAAATWATAAWCRRSPCQARPHAQHHGHAAAAGGGGVPKDGERAWPRRCTTRFVIIGGGHNGLVTAAYLARAGRKVLVLERREMVGGCAVTEEIWPGYRVSTGAYLISLLQERIVRDLELERFGYRVDAKDPAFFSAFPDGRHLFMWQDRSRRRSRRSRSSRGATPKSIPKYEDHLERLSRVVENPAADHPAGISARAPRRFCRIPASCGAGFANSTREDLVALVKIFTQSAADFLDEWFESPEVKVTLATDGVIGANGGPRSPGTAYILLHHCMGGVGGSARACGDSCAAAWARSRRPSRHPRAQPRRRDPHQRAGGAECWSATAAPAAWCWRTARRSTRDCVASNLDPKLTFLQPARRARTRRRISSRPSATSASKARRCKMNLALDGLPDFTRLPGAPGPQHGATMHICPSIEYVERAWDDAKYGRPSRVAAARDDHPHHVRSVARAAGPAHHGHLSAIRAVHACATALGTNCASRSAIACMDLIAEYAPNIRDIVLERQVLTPLDLERRFGITGGNIFHGEMSLDQMFVMRPVAGWARYRTPVAGLYLCGSGAHPGGGVMGAPGYNAAREILRDR